MFHLHLRDDSPWRPYPATIRWFVGAMSVTLAMSGQAKAQPVDYAANPSVFEACESQPSRLAAQMARASSSTIEPSAGPRLGSKSEAILNGRLSKLEQMRLAQASEPSNISTAVPDTTANSHRLPIEHCNDDAAYQPHLGIVSPTVMPANAILGSLSISVSNTPFDRKWSMVNGRQAKTRVERLLQKTGARRANDPLAQIEAVNRWVNRNIAFGEDRDIYGDADYWAPATETFRRGVGDCEDFAIAKMELLATLGIERKKMRLVVARDLVRNADHAVLVVTLTSGSVMLDNVTDRVLDARLPNDYRPIMSFSQNGKWVHGYATQVAQPIRMASANTLPQPAANRAKEVSTVTPQPELPVFSLALLSVPLVLPTELSARA